MGEKSVPSGLQTRIEGTGFPEGVRSLSPKDLARVVDIDAQYSLRSRRGFFEKRLAAARRRPHKNIHVGYQSGNKLAGFLLAHLLDEEFGQRKPTAILDAIAIDHDVLDRGIGRLLLASAEHLLRDRGVSIIETQADWRSTLFVRFLAAAGFVLAPQAILEHDLSQPIPERLIAPRFQASPAAEANFSDPQEDDFYALSRDRIPCRSMRSEDLEAILRIARLIDGSDHAAYYRDKMDESLTQSGIRVSMVAELNGRVVGFVMASVDFGDFGRAEPAAVIDSIGIERECAHRGVGTALLSQLVANLGTLRSDTVRTVVAWDRSDLLGFFHASGFAPSQSLAFSRRIF